MSLVLGLDTTSRNCSLAIARSGDVLIEYNFTTRDELSATLIPTIDFVVRSAGITLNEIDVFGICVGPGLFTGIRVGLTTLKGLLFNDWRPVVAVTSLEAHAFKLQDINTPVVPILDAKRQEVYIGCFQKKDQLPEELKPPRLVHSDHFADVLADQGTFSALGSGALLYREKLKEIFPDSKFVWRSPFLAAEICRLSQLKHQAGLSISSPEELRPLYIREPDALQKKQSSPT